MSRRSSVESSHSSASSSSSTSSSATILPNEQSSAATLFAEERQISDSGLRDEPSEAIVHRSLQRGEHQAPNVGFSATSGEREEQRSSDISRRSSSGERVEQQAPSTGKRTSHSEREAPRLSADSRHGSLGTSTISIERSVEVNISRSSVASAETAQADTANTSSDTQLRVRKGRRHSSIKGLGLSGSDRLAALLDSLGTKSGSGSRTSNSSRESGQNHSSAPRRSGSSSSSSSISSMSHSSSHSSSSSSSENETDTVPEGSGSAWRSTLSRRSRACMLAAIQTLSQQELDAFLEPGQVQVILEAGGNLRAEKKQMMRKPYPGSASKLQLNRFASHRFDSTSEKVRRSVQRQRRSRLKGRAHPNAMHPQYQVVQAYHRLHSPSIPRNVKDQDETVSAAHKAYATWRHLHGEAENKLYGLAKPGVPAAQRGKLGGA